MDAYALDDAATAALWPLRALTHERLGALYSDGDSVAYTETLGGDAARASGRLSVPAGSLRGTFHNHPRLSKRDKGLDEFSAVDMLNAKKLGVPSYIAADDRVMRYDPRTRKAEEVLAQFPIDEWRAQIMQTILGRSPDDPRGAYR